MGAVLSRSDPRVALSAAHAAVDELGGLDLTGLSEAQLLEMNFLDFNNGADLAEEMHETRRLFRGEIESFCSERRYEHPEGRTVWARMHVSLVRGADGAPA